MGGETQLAERAEHTVRCNASELALFNFHAIWKCRTVKSCGNEIAHIFLSDVGSACNYLNRLSLAYIYLTHNKVVGIFVGLYVEYLSHNNTGYLAALSVIFFNLGAAHCKSRAKLLYAHISDINIIGEPSY